jgi:hypothetical protein
VGQENRRLSLTYIAQGTPEQVRADIEARVKAEGNTLHDAYKNYHPKQ